MEHKANKEVMERIGEERALIHCYVYSLPLCYFTQSALPKYQTGCCSVLHVLLCPAKRIKQARCLFVCAPETLLKLSSRDRSECRSFLLMIELVYFWSKLLCQEF